MHSDQLLSFFPVDGGWTPWSVWSDCSVTCGRGAQVQTRACINPPPRNNGSDCTGPDRETQECHTLPCLGLYRVLNSTLYIELPLQASSFCTGNESRYVGQYLLFYQCPCLQMTFVPGLHGHHAPRAVAQGQYCGRGCVCVKKEVTLRVLLRLRPAETERRRSFVTDSLVQVMCTSQKSIISYCFQCVWVYVKRNGNTKTCSGVELSPESSS